MSTKLILGPASSGKTHRCIERVRALLTASPLSEVWVVLPDSHQAGAFRRRIAVQGGAMGVHIGTFADLHAEVLALAGAPIPVAPSPVVRRLAVAAIDAVAEQGQLQHYGSIRRQPGLATALTRLVAELKRAQIEPDSFAAAVGAGGRRLVELASLYREYQDRLIALQWADVEGLGWLAVRALEADSSLAQHWKLVVADGFDDLVPTQLATLKLLSARVGETIVTLTGDLEMKRVAYRRFSRTLHRIQAQLDPQVEMLDHAAQLPPALAHLEKSLFDPSAIRFAPEEWSSDSGQANHTPRERPVSFVEAQTTALEARQALRWLKAHIQRDGVQPHECAVMARDLAPYRALLSEAGREFGLPLEFAGGEPLASNPAVAAILNLLELTIAGWPRRSLVDALRTPYFDRTRFRLGPTDALRLDRAARWGQVVEGLDQWQETLTRLAAQTPQPASEEDDETAGPPPIPQGEPAKQLWDALQAFAQAVTPAEKTTLVEFVVWIENLISKDPGLGVIEQTASQADTSERDRAALAAFNDILRTLVLTERIVGERGERAYADWYADLRAAIEAASYVPEDPRRHSRSRIYCASLSQARGVPYRAVALLGLSEGLFPAPLDEDPFLPDADRERLAAQGLPIELVLRSDQQSLFYEAVTRASEFLLLTRPYLADDGEAWLASPFWNGVRALFDADPQRVRAEDAPLLADCASGVELLTAAVRRRALPKSFSDLTGDWQNLRYAGAILRARLAREAQGPFEGQLTALESDLSDLFGPRRLWSASALETYAACGFRFLIDHGLGLEEAKTPAAGYDSSQLGRMLHKILENVYARVDDPTNVEAVLEALAAVAREVFDAAPAECGFRPLLIWDKQQAELLDRLEETIRHLAEEEAGFRPAHFEKRFGSPPLRVETPAGPILFRGVVDRVDVDDHGRTRVIDYKTGASRYDNRSLGEGKSLQLALYALAVEHALKLGPVEDGFYWGILKGAPSPVDLKSFKFTDSDGRAYSGFRAAVELTIRHVTADVQDVRAGRFTPIPPREGCPDYCAARTICWRYEPSEH